MKFKHQAKALKEIRLEMGLTQHDLAKILGIHNQALSNMERGRAGVPIKRVVRIKDIDLRSELANAITLDFQERVYKEFKL